MAPDATDEQIKNDLITGYSDLQGLGCKQAAYDNIAQRPDEPVRSYIVRYSRLFKLLNGTAPNKVRMRTTSMHFVNSLRSYLSSKVENRLLGMNERNYSLGDTFTVALQCELKAIASERRHNKRNTITINNVNSEDQDHTQLKDTQEVHVRNPNYKGKNYDPNYQARKTENKQQQQPTMTNNQYKAPYTRPAANNNNLASSSDIAGEVTLKMTIDGYQLLKMNELIKNAAAWQARMPKIGRFDKYFDNKETTKTMPKVQINSTTLQVMGQAAKDYGYTKDEFIEAVEMYEHFGNVNLEDVPAPSPQDLLRKQYQPDKDVNSTDTHFVDTCTIAVGPTTGTVFPISCNNVNINTLYDTGASMSCMSLKTFDSLKLNLTKERFPLVITATGTSMDPIGFTQCTFLINRRSFTQKFIVCTNQTRPVILGKDFSARNCIGIIWTKQGSRKMIDDDNTTIMEVFEQTTDIPLSLANPIRIPPHSIVVAVVECNRPLHPHMDIKGDAGFLREYPNIHVSRTYVNNPNTSSNCIPFSFTNLSMHSQYLGKNKVVGFAEPTTDAVEVHELADYDEIKEMMRGPRNHVSRKKQAKYKLPAVPIDNAFLTSPADIPGSRKVDLQDADVKPTTRSAFDELCEKYPTIFSRGNEDIGRTQLITMDIDMGDSPPVRSYPYTLALKHHQWVQSEIETLERAGVITKSMSPWDSPIVVVPKKSQHGEPPKKRLCIDFRKINNLQQAVITEGKSKGCLSLVPLPKIDEMYVKLKGAKFFSTIDLRSGYYHIALGKDSRAKMAFVTPFGKYKFLQVPFGLAQTPAYFQHLINQVLDNCSFAMTYLDDIIILGETEEQHLAHIEEIFKRLEAADLKMK